jgi:hypothetical protein
VVVSAKDDAIIAALKAEDPAAELERRGWTYRGVRRNLRWYRTMPFNAQSKGRSFVIDDPQQVTAFYHDGYNSYRPVMEHLHTDAVLLDWDMAISREDRWRFEQHIADDPDHVHIAPYPLYRGPRHTDIPPGEFRYAAFPAESVRDQLPGMHPEYRESDREDFHIVEGESHAASFGFGCIYLPLYIVKRFLDEVPTPQVSDGLFSVWHYHTFGEVPVHWDVRPIHLNYSVDDYQ